MQMSKVQSMESPSQPTDVPAQSEPFLSRMNTAGLHSSRTPNEVTVEAERKTVRASDASSSRSKSASPVTEERHWRPFYLRRSVLAAFCVIFTLILAAIEALFVNSTRNDGIATSTQGEHYLWTYGPTALLTLVAAVFSRVEFQSKTFAPWEHMAGKTCNATDCLLLDYVSDFQPIAIWKALRNKDFTVAATTVVSLLIKLMIVLSTGLITLSLTRVHRGSASMTLQDRFNNNASSLAAVTSLPYFVMQGLVESNLAYPMGISNDFAFQSFVQMAAPSTAQSQASVDGLTNSLNCEKVDLNMTGAAPVSPHYPENTMNFTINSTDCEMKLRLTAPPESTLFGRLAQGRCDGTSDDLGRRVLIVFGSLQYHTDYSQNITDYTGQNTFNPTVGELLESTQLLCAPSYTMATIDVVQNGTNVQKVTLAPEGAPNRTLDNVTPWSIMDAHFAAYEANTLLFPDDNGYEGGVFTIYLDGHAQTPVSVDPYSSLILQFGGASDTTPSSGFFNQTTLYQAATAYYRQFGAIVAKQYLMENDNTQITGKVILMENRLVVRLWSAQIMAALAAICGVLSSVCILTASNRTILAVPRDPGTLYGMAATIAQSPDLLRKLRNMGDADEGTLRKGLEASSFRSAVAWQPSSGLKAFTIQDSTTDTPNGGFQSETQHTTPMVLRLTTRVVLCLVLVALIVTLELTLRKSSSEDGLGDVGNNDTYIHYLWTSLPSVLFGSLAMAFSAIDFKTRSLVPFLMLRKAVSTKTFMSFHILDASVPHAIWKEIGLKHIGSLASTITMLIASFFTIFSGSLFQEVTFPTSRTLNLRANNSFPVGGFWNLDEHLTSNGMLAASLVLESNLTFPNFTYGDLVFPQFLLDTSELSEQDKALDLSTTSINAIIPSLRTRLQCRMYTSSSIHTNLTLNYTSQDDIHNPLWIDIDGEDCHNNGKGFEDDQEGYTMGFGIETNVSYFGKETRLDFDQWGCSNYLFTWGRLDFGNVDNPIRHIAAMGCNESFETVSVNATFTGSLLAVDSTQPPQPLEDTSHNTTAGFPVTGWDDLQLVDVHTEDLLDSFFALLTNSRWAIPVYKLGGGPAYDSNNNDSTSDSSDVDAEVAAAIQLQHSIIVAQVLNSNRVAANTTNTTLAYPPPASLTDGNDAMPRYTAKATDKAGRRRVAQDATSTRILETLLALALVLLVVAWVDLRHTDVLAASPTTIASVVALLAGGNIVEQMPPLRAGRSSFADCDDEDIWRAFGPKTRFWLGWNNVPDDEGIRMGNENENGLSRFGIFAISNTGDIELKPLQERELASDDCPLLP